KPSAALVAMAASTALPPFLRTSTPACTASGCAAATMPWRAYTTERVANDRPAGRSEGAIGGAHIEMTSTAARRRRMKPPVTNGRITRCGGVRLEMTIRLPNGTIDRPWVGDDTSPHDP